MRVLRSRVSLPRAADISSYQFTYMYQTMPFNLFIPKLT